MVDTPDLHLSALGLQLFPSPAPSIHQSQHVHVSSPAAPHTLLTDSNIHAAYPSPNPPWMCAADHDPTRNHHASTPGSTTSPDVSDSEPDNDLAQPTTSELPPIHPSLLPGPGRIPEFHLPAPGPLEHTRTARAPPKGMVEIVVDYLGPGELQRLPQYVVVKQPPQLIRTGMTICLVNTHGHRLKNPSTVRGVQSFYRKAVSF